MKIPSAGNAYKVFIMTPKTTKKVMYEMSKIVWHTPAQSFTVPLSEYLRISEEDALDNYYELIEQMYGEAIEFQCNKIKEKVFK